jgi:endonuclease-3
VAVVLSAQATDRSVNLLMPSLIAHAETPEKMVALGISWVRDLIKTIGLYQKKSEYIMGLSHQLIAQHGGQVPHKMEDLVALPGVGRKTANVVLNVIFGHPSIPVDTHVARVSKRLGWVDPCDQPVKIEHILDETIPMPWKKHIHAWFILHGRNVCTARAPACTRCPIHSACVFYGKNTP